MRSDSGSSSSNITVIAVPGGTQSVPYEAEMTVAIAIEKAGFTIGNLDVRLNNQDVARDAVATTSVSPGDIIHLLEDVTGN